MLEQRFGIHTVPTASQAAAQAPTIVIAVKPQVVSDVALDVASRTDLAGKLFISVAAGVGVSTLERMLGSQRSIVRAMPNIAASVGEGATGFFANRCVNAAQIETTSQILGSFGICLQLQEEAQVEVVTALSGSGPAYFFLMMEAMIQTGVKLGLTEAIATRFTLQTIRGAAAMAQANEDTLRQLRSRVTSPKGTTQAAIETLTSGGFELLIERAVESAHGRALQLAEGR